MFANTLYKNTGKVLALLAKEDFIKAFYLAGGTALSLQLGHRKSIDLDFFTNQKFIPKELSLKLSQLGKLKINQETEGSLSGELDGVRLSFFYYQHDTLNDFKSFQEIQLADPIDIALMKITAIAGRGSRKDLIDLYKIAREIKSLKELFGLLPSKFRKVQYEPYYLIKGLTHFDDAEKEPMPDMLEDIEWDDVKSFFIKEAPSLVPINKK